MPRQRFYDVPGGDTVLYDIVDESNGYRQSTFRFEEKDRSLNFRKIKDFNCRDDDIFLHSYPKTVWDEKHGWSNWLWEMMTMMMNNTSKISPNIKGDSFIEMHPLSVIYAQPSPRILNTHIKTRYIPQDVVQKKLKNVILCRNPKDVVVSFYNHTKGFKIYEYDGKFDNYLQMFMRGDVDYGSYPEYLLEWQEFIRSHPDVPSHVILYEDLKKNCVKELKRLRDFLELEVTNDLLQEIADNCNINKMRDSKAEVMSQEAKEVLKQVVNRGFSLMRKGQIGDWKNWFTVAQSEMFDEWWEKESKGLEMFKFEFS